MGESLLSEGRALARCTSNHVVLDEGEIMSLLRLPVLALPRGTFCLCCLQSPAGG